MKRKSFKATIRERLMKHTKVCGLCGENIEKEIWKMNCFIDYQRRRGRGEDLGKIKYRRKAINMSIDHKTPKSKGGTWEMANLHLVHKHCNNRKSDLDLSTYKSLTQEVILL